MRVSRHEEQEEQEEHVEHVEHVEQEKEREGQVKEGSEREGRGIIYTGS